MYTHLVVNVQEDAWYPHNHNLSKKDLEKIYTFSYNAKKLQIFISVPQPLPDHHNTSIMSNCNFD